MGATRRRRTLREKIKLLIFFLIIFNLPEQNPKGPLDLLSPNVVNETHAPGLFSKSEAVPKQRQNIRSLEAPVRETCAEQNETRRFFNKAREQEWFRSGLVVASHSSDTFCHNPPPPLRSLTASPREFVDFLQINFLAHLPPAQRAERLQCCFNFDEAGVRPAAQKTSSCLFLSYAERSERAKIVE